MTRHCAICVGTLWLRWRSVRLAGSAANVSTTDPSSAPAAMPPKRSRASGEAAGKAKKARRSAPPGAPTVAEQHVHIPSAAAQQELAAVLGRDSADFPLIRKTKDTPPKYSVYDVVMLIKECNAEHAAQEFRRLRERYGDGCTNCAAIRFRDSIGRLRGNETPAATIERIVEIETPQTLCLQPRRRKRFVHSRDAASVLSKAEAPQTFCLKPRRRQLFV